MMPTPVFRRRAVPQYLLTFSLSVAGLAGAVRLGAAAQVERPAVPPKGPVRRMPEETMVGWIVKAELRQGAQITFPAAPNMAGLDIPHNGPVARNKGMTLLILDFEVQQSHCVRLDGDALLVKDGTGKTYRYGGWWVEEAKYTLCGRPDFARPIVGPWENPFWDPLTIRPELGQFRLVYEVDPDAKKLTFTDGKVTIDVDGLLKR